MDIEEIKENSKKMLATFINEINLDGEWYSEINNTPMLFKPISSPGRFYSPESPEIQEFLQQNSFDKQTEENIYKNGVILISSEYTLQEPTDDLYISLIHEMIHANRNLLLFDSFQQTTGLSPYNFNNQKIEQNTNNYTSRNVDPSQDILKANIDDSQKTINSYRSKTPEEIEDMQFENYPIDDKLDKPKNVDEALVEIMGILSYQLYTIKQKNEKIDIWSTLKNLQETHHNKDIRLMCEIILKHHDFELFYWMLDPIAYSKENIHYDFFADYTKNDTDLLEDFYDSAIEIYDDFSGFYDTNVSPIKTSDIKQVATSPTAMEQLSNSLKDIKYAHSSLENENENEDER